jgi:hypothetical protein
MLPVRVTSSTFAAGTPSSASTSGVTLEGVQPGYSVPPALKYSW